MMRAGGRLHRLLLLGVLGLSAGVRWMQPGLVEFKYDEAHIFGMARGIASGHYWPILSGGTSIGLPRAALDAYILAVPLALTGHSPQAAVIWLGMWGVVAVALTYVLGRGLAGPRVGLLAAAYMGLNPWLIYYDRKFWAHIQVVFSVLLLLLAWLVVVKDRDRARFWFPVVAAWQLLTHVLALVQGLSWAAALLISPRRWLHKKTLAGVVVGLTLLLPYLLALARRTFQSSAAQVLPAVASPEISGGQPLLDRWRLAWLLISGDRIFELTGSGVRVTPWDEWLGWTGWVMGGIALFGVGITLVRWLRPREGGLSSKSAALLLAWGVGPWLALSFGPMQVYLQYWTVLLPLPALFFAVGMDGSWERLEIWREDAGLNPAYVLRKGGAVLAVGMLLLIWVGSWGSVLERIDGGAGWTTFGRPLRNWQAGIQQAEVWAQKLDVQQVKVLAHGVDPGLDGEPAAVAALIGNPPFARFLDLGGATPGILLHATQPSLYLTTDAQMQAALDALGEEVWQDGADHPLRLYVLPPAPQADIPVTWLDTPAMFDLGVELAGYLFPDPWPAGQSVQPMLVWRMTQPTEQAWQGDYTAFNHLLAEGTETLAVQVDGMALLSRDWWPEDVLYQLYPMTLMEGGAYRWRTGLYSRLDGRRAQLVSGGDAVELPVHVQGP